MFSREVIFLDFIGYLISVYSISVSIARHHAEKSEGKKIPLRAHAEGAHNVDEVCGPSTHYFKPFA